MKNVKLLLLVVMGAFFSLQANSQVNDTLTFSFNDVTFDTIGSYVRPSLVGCHYTDVVDTEFTLSGNGLFTSP